MEEWVGALWHRAITRASGGHYADAAVSLPTVQRPLAIFFRALGGDSGLRIAQALEVRHGARRRWLSRLAGTDEKAPQARRDEITLRLPLQIDFFKQSSLNRDLYFWLAALAACLPEAPGTTDFEINQEGTCIALARWPGLASRYHRLVEAHLAMRLPPDSLPDAQAQAEQNLRQALRHPGSTKYLPSCTPPLASVPLWLQNVSPLANAGTKSAAGDQATNGAATPQAEGQTAYAAEHAPIPQEKNGLLMIFRAESLLSVAEFFRINRPIEDDAPSEPNHAARDLDVLTLSQDGMRSASKVRFDLDLPASAEDDIPLGSGHPFPEWDYRKQVMRPNFVRIKDFLPKNAQPAPLPVVLKPLARQIRRQFEQLRTGYLWRNGQNDGSECDIDAFVRLWADRHQMQSSADHLYRQQVRRSRDFACLVLADLSLSTDSWISNDMRVIDVIRDSLLLLGEALAATGDRFALAGFSSLRRNEVRYYPLKAFSHPFDDETRGRLQAIRPGYYTRMGAAIRRATQSLTAQIANKHILLILSDGKPNDLDLYDGRYGIEDTHMAILEARRAGCTPFCVTIDREGASYLPHLFGVHGFRVIRRPEELPLHLPHLYAQLTTH